jgi:hypothetical protein
LNKVGFYDGYLFGLKNIHKTLKQGGKFYLSDPIGSQRIEFNRQRVFSLSYLLGLLQHNYKIDHFPLVDDIENNFGSHYGLGIFEMTKL